MVIKKFIQNTAEYPWLDWIEVGKKKYEGRLCKEDWSKLKVGAKIVFSVKDSNRAPVTVNVTELKYYDDFGLAFDDLGQELIPISGITREKVIELYSEFFSDDDVKKYKVVAVGVAVC